MIWAWRVDKLEAYLCLKDFKQYTDVEDVSKENFGPKENFIFDLLPLGS